MINRANIILTHNCNLKCKHCYMNAGCSKENYNLTYEKIVAIINKLKADGVQSIMFTGGECMLFPKLYDLITLTKTLGIKVGIFTNGMIFNKEIFDLVDFINISIDGNEKIHNEIRQNNKSFKNILKVLDYLKEIDKYTTIQYTINSNNIDDINWLPTVTLNYLNIRNVKLVFVMPIGRAKDNNLYHNIDTIDKVFSSLDKMYEDSKFHTQFIPNVINEFDFNNYYLQGNIQMPIWIDMIDNTLYLLESKKIDVNNYSKEIVDKEQKRLNNLLIDNTKKIISNKYIDVEQILNQIEAGEL